MKNISEKDFKPTFDEPKSDSAIEFQDKFDKTMVSNGIQLEEVDNMLNEKEQSLKKKIWNLSKMEALVHADPKLSAVYDNMAEEGEEKYGYHYNETIMNIMFNDYVLNDPKYLEKYKQAVGKEKKRRDKSGINALRKDAEDMEKRRADYKKEKAAKASTVKSLNERVNRLYESSGSLISSAGSFESPVGFKDDVKNISKEIDTEKEKKNFEKVEVALPGQEKRAYGKFTPSGIGVSSAVVNPEPNKEIKKPYYPGGNMVDKLNENMDLNSAKTKAQQISKEEGVVQHVNMTTGDNYSVQDWYDEDSTVASYENGRELNENKEEQIEETTSAGSAAGAGTSYVGYAGPSAWGSGELAGGKKTKKDKESFWKGGKMVEEENPLTESKLYEELYAELDEAPSQDMITTKEDLRGFIQTLKQRTGKGLTKDHIPMLAGEALYAIAVKIADGMLPLPWNQMSDTNSMWDYIDENGGMKFEDLKAAVKDAVNDRISGEDIGMDGLFEDQLDEKSKSKAQQRFMGMVHAYKKGELKDSEVSQSVKDAAKSMSADDAEDFASTKHDKLPEKVDELFGIGKSKTNPDIEEAKKEVMEYNFHRMFYQPAQQNPDYKKGVEIRLIQGKKELPALSKVMPELFEPDQPAANAFSNGIRGIIPGKWTFMLDNSHDITERGRKYLMDKLESGELNENPALMALGTAAATGAGQAIGSRVADKVGLEETMIDAQEDSMKMQPPINTQGGDFPTGMQVAGGINENKKQDKIMEEAQKHLKELNKELSLYEMHHKSLKEDRKPSTLVMKDRLGGENAKNFKTDLNHSGTKEIIDTTKELEWKDQQTDVEDPQKLSKELEKTMLKNTDGSHKNVGNSSNNKGDEIPKRNLTSDEQNEVDLYRKGLGDVNFDNEPDERYMERMKRDMGEREFKNREARMEFESDKPMYNKDTQPVEDGLEKDQFDKNKSKWNDRMGISESTMSGKYVDEQGKTRFFDFSTLNIKEVKEVKNNAFFKLNVAGMGNTYNSKVQMLEGVEKAINEWEFYTDGNDVVVVNKSVQNLNENEQKIEKRPVDEQYNKMQHLLGYKPQDFVNSKKSKL